MDARPTPCSDVRVVRRRLATPRPATAVGLLGRGTSFVAGASDGAPSDATPSDGTSAGGWNQELPSTSIELVFELDGRWDLQIDGHDTEARAFAAGLVAGPVRTRARGSVRLVQLTVDPLATMALFGAPAGSLAGTAVDLEALLGVDHRRLLDRLDAAFETGDAVAVAEAWVRERTGPATADTRVPADVIRACALMRGSGGMVHTQAVADELGCSRRHLARRFDEYVGVPPSQFVRLVRFGRATAALRRDPQQPLAPLAFEAGYADHAHMVRDFHSLAGATPSQVAAQLAA